MDIYTTRKFHEHKFSKAITRSAILFVCLASIYSATHIFRGAGVELVLRIYLVHNVIRLRDLPNIYIVGGNLWHFLLGLNLSRRRHSI